MRPACKLLTVAMLLLAACAAPPDTARFKIDFERGVKAYEVGDYEAARQLWQPLADNYDLAALRNLGHLYRFGQGVAKNGRKASGYYEKAAKLGHAPSQTNLAQMYFSGALIERDTEKAMQWLEKAAAQGYPPATQLLAIKTQNFEFHSR
jgi:TPR repeat protein